MIQSSLVNGKQEYRSTFEREADLLKQRVKNHGAGRKLYDAAVLLIPYGIPGRGVQFNRTEAKEFLGDERSGRDGHFIFGIIVVTSDSITKTLAITAGGYAGKKITRPW
jgi:hypothetical protein